MICAPRFVLSDAYQQLSTDWSLLREQWQATRYDWQDAVATRFEKEYWREYEEVLPLLLRELLELDETVERAFRSL